MIWAGVEVLLDYDPEGQTSSEVVAKILHAAFVAAPARERFEAALRAGFKTPAKPHSEMKLGKSKPKQTPSKTAKSKP